MLAGLEMVDDPEIDAVVVSVDVPDKVAEVVAVLPIDFEMVGVTVEAKLVNELGCDKVAGVLAELPPVPDAVVVAVAPWGLDTVLLSVEEAGADADVVPMVVIELVAVLVCVRVNAELGVLVPELVTVELTDAEMLDGPKLETELVPVVEPEEATVLDPELECVLVAGPDSDVVPVDECVLVADSGAGLVLVDVMGVELVVVTKLVAVLVIELALELGPDAEAVGVAVGGCNVAPEDVADPDTLDWPSWPPTAMGGEETALVTAELKVGVPGEVSVLVVVLRLVV